jgi:hypothetical protein
MAKGFNVNTLISFFKKNQRNILIGVAVVVVLFFFGFFDKIMGSLSCGHKLVEGLDGCLSSTESRRILNDPTKRSHYFDRLSPVADITNFCRQFTDQEQCNSAVQDRENCSKDNKYCKTVYKLKSDLQHDDPENNMCQWSSGSIRTDSSARVQRQRCKLAYDNITNTNTTSATRYSYCNRIGLFYDENTNNNLSNDTPNEEYHDCYNNYNGSKITEILDGCSAAARAVEEEAAAQSESEREVEEVPSPHDDDCNDSNPFCQNWAADGECRRNPEWMNVYCKRSCNQCTLE